jgi:DNA-directed RNA polymerase subunit M/transcription elongation factor TFIIS
MTIVVEPTKDSELCPECGALCYWSVYPPRELSCCQCGYLVKKENKEEKAGKKKEKEKRTIVRNDLNG